LPLCSKDAKKRSKAPWFWLLSLTLSHRKAELRVMMLHPQLASLTKDHALFQYIGWKK